MFARTEHVQNNYYLNDFKRLSYYKFVNEHEWKSKKPSSEYLYLSVDFVFSFMVNFKRQERQGKTVGFLGPRVRNIIYRLTGNDLNNDPTCLT